VLLGIRNLNALDGVVIPEVMLSCALNELDLHPICTNRVVIGSSFHTRLRVLHKRQRMNRESVETARKLGGNEAQNVHRALRDSFSDLTDLVGLPTIWGASVFIR
jgi:hypothetical protein